MERAGLTGLSGRMVRLAVAVATALSLFACLATPAGPFATPVAFADEEQPAVPSSDPAGPLGPDEPPSENIPPAEPSPLDPKVVDIAIYYHDTNDALGYASSAARPANAKIAAKGGSLELDSVIFWDDWASADRNSYLVAWSVDDPEIATITQGGVLTARRDGTVKVKAFVSDAKSATGAELVCEIDVDVAGQTNASYVSAIHIADAEGNEIADASYVMEGDLSVAQTTFFAHVDVFDPASETTTTYDTAAGPLSVQLPGFSDVKWYVGDASVVTVDEDSGMFRPQQYCIAQVFAYSDGGFDNQRVSARITVQVKDPDGGKVKEGYFPQDTFTVKAYWSDFPPTDMHDDDDERFVIDKTYSVDEMESMGTATYTYTALGGGNYFTMTGYGVLLATVLANAGIDDLGAVSSLEFGTADLIDRPVSFDFVFGTSRYYYPKINYGMYADRVQVPPIVAIASNEAKNAGADPDYDMSEATRFRLLFGATPEGGSSSYQIKWIHTLYVRLNGSPASHQGDGSGGSGGGGGQGAGPGGSSGDGSGSSADGATPAGDPSGGSPADDGGLGPAAEGEQAVEKAAFDPQRSVAAQAGGLAGQLSGTPDDTGTTVDAQAASGPKFSVYQMMNVHDVREEMPYNPDNPYKGLAGGLGAVMLLAGGVGYFVWYRRQLRGVSLVLGEAAAPGAAR